MLHRLKPKRRLNAGFTLIEILIVVVILGVLASIVVVNVMDAPDKARVAKAQTDIAALQNALKFYRLENGFYPSQAQGLQALVKRPESEPIPRNWKTGGYIEKLPKDPWGVLEYQYLNPGVHGEIDIFTFGRDGKPGGEGYDADIGSWDVNR